jgi:hypothetical protein
MAAELVTIFRKSANGRIEAVDVEPDEAASFIATTPFAWSLSPAPASFAAWPWPPVRGEVVEPPSIADMMGAPSASKVWDRST